MGEQTNIRLYISKHPSDFNALYIPYKINYYICILKEFHLKKYFIVIKNRIFNLTKEFFFTFLQSLTKRLKT